MLASFGEKLKVHSIVNGQIVEVAEYSGNYHCNHITWTANGEWLVGPIRYEGILPIFKFEKNKLSCKRSIVDDNLSAIAHFNFTDEEVIVGSKNGAVYKWNVEEKKISENICKSDGKLIKFIEASSDDKYIAACGGYLEKPFIKLLDVTTSRLTNTYILNKCCEISDIKFSPICNYLGCSTMEGAVICFDINKNNQIFSKKVGACTAGIAMSPDDHNLIMSVAMSQTVVVHDVRTQTPALTATVNRYLTAVDIIKTEPYAVMGSSDGYLLLFDVRNSKIVSDVMVGASRVTAVRSYPKEDLGNNIPEEPAVLEISLIDLCTPPIPANHVRKSNVRFSAGNNSSPDYSTPKDSPMKMLDSPVQNACHDTPSALSLSEIEEEEDEDSNPVIIKEVTQVIKPPDASLGSHDVILAELSSRRREIDSLRLKLARRDERLFRLIGELGGKSLNAMEENACTASPIDHNNSEALYLSCSEIEEEEDEDSNPVIIKQVTQVIKQPDASLGSHDVILAELSSLRREIDSIPMELARRDERLFGLIGELGGKSLNAMEENADE